MEGRKPNLLAYATLVLLAEEGLPEDPPPKERKGLILLAVALEAWHRGCGTHYLQDLERLAKDLKRGGDGCLKEVLRSAGGSLRSLLPDHYKHQPLLDGLRSYLSGDASGYRARDLWRAFLRRLGQGAEAKAPALDCLGPPPAVPEFLLALLPVPAMHRALVRTLGRAHGVAEGDLEASLSALFAYLYVRSATCQKSWHPLLFQGKGDLDAGHQDGYAWLVRRKGGETIAEAEERELRAHLKWDQPLASPRLVDVMRGWYEVADAMLGTFPLESGKVFCGPEGYDWDLVEEYHEAVLEALRDGVWPRFFAESPQASHGSAKKEEL